MSGLNIRTGERKCKPGVGGGSCTGSSRDTVILLSLEVLPVYSVAEAYN